MVACEGCGFVIDELGWFYACDNCKKNYCEKCGSGEECPTCKGKLKSITKKSLL